MPRIRAVNLMKGMFQRRERKISSGENPAAKDREDDVVTSKKSENPMLGDGTTSETERVIDKILQEVIDDETREPLFKAR